MAWSEWYGKGQYCIRYGNEEQSESSDRLLYDVQIRNHVTGYFHKRRGYKESRKSALIFMWYSQNCSLGEFLEKYSKPPEEEVLHVDQDEDWPVKERKRFPFRTRARTPLDQG